MLMKKTIKAFALGLSLLASVSVCYAQDFAKGLAAHQNGDFATALRELRPLAAQGDANAQFHLGNMYYKGQGVIQDNVYAHMWWNIAASSGNKNAAENRDIVASKMTASQIEKAQDLARECVKKEYKAC